jgi:hypothetical protein
VSGRLRRLSGLAAGLFLLGAASATAQTPPPASAAPSSPTQPPPSSVPVPDQLELSKLIWTTMATVDAANLSGNYSVLRDLAAPSFQANNDPAALTQVFASIRATRIDLSNTLLLAPTYAGPPQMLPNGLLRLRGMFALRPTAIVFDLEYQWVQGRWRLYGIALEPHTIAAMQPAQAPPSTHTR